MDTKVSNKQTEHIYPGLWNSGFLNEEFPKGRKGFTHQQTKYDQENIEADQDGADKP